MKMAVKREKGRVDLFGERFRARAHQLSPRLLAVASYINDNREAVLERTAMEIASATNTSDATVVRAINLAPTQWLHERERLTTMEKLLAEGLTRAIGVSNFYPDRLVDLVEHNEVVPAINQIETHPFFQRADYQELLASLGVRIESWGPFAEGRNGLFTNAELAAIGAAHGKSVAQVVLRWHTLIGSVPLPKSADPQRQVQNLTVAGISLDEDDLAAIAALDRPAGRIWDQDPATYEEF